MAVAPGSQASAFWQLSSLQDANTSCGTTFFIPLLQHRAMVIMSYTEVSRHVFVVNRNPDSESDLIGTSIDDGQQAHHTN